MFVDFWVILDWARELLSGRYEKSLYPPSALIFYFPFLFLEPNVALSLFLLLSLVCFVLAFGRKSVYWIAFMPALQTLLLAHPDILFVFLLKRKTPLTFALLTLKPILFLVSLPDWFLMGVRNKIKFVIYILLLYLPSFILVANWPEIYIENLFHNGVADKRFYAVQFLTQNIELTIIGIIGILLLLNKRNFRYLLMLFISFSFFMSYNYVLFTGTQWIFIPLSWLFVNLQSPPWISFNYYFVLIPILLYVKESDLCQFMIINVRIAILNSQKFYRWMRETSGLSVLNVKNGLNVKLPEHT